MKASKPPSEEAAWARLLRWFAIRPRSARETDQRLARWGVEREAAERLIDRLRRGGLLDDGAFAEGYARELAGKGYRGHVLRARLQSRGIDRGTAAGAEAEVDYQDAAGKALEVARRRARAMPPDAAVARRRLVAYLLRRGFRRDDAESAAATALGER